MINRKTDKKSRIDIKHIAKLANLPISDSEEKTFESQLTEIIGYIDQIEKGVDTSNVEPTFNVSPNNNIKRPDTAKESLNQESAVSNSQSAKNGYFVTKGVFESE